MGLVLYCRAFHMSLKPAYDDVNATDIRLFGDDFYITTNQGRDCKAYALKFNYSGCEFQRLMIVEGQEKPGNRRVIADFRVAGRVDGVFIHDIQHQ